MTGDLININGHQLYLEVTGAEAGFPVVLLHHGLGSVYSWSQQIHALVDAGFRVVAYDRWGYGNSDQRKQLRVPYFEEDLSDLDQILKHLKINLAALVGHSDGGTIALYFAARYPQRIACVVTIAAHIYIEKKMHAGIDGLLKNYQIKESFRKGMQRAHGSAADRVFQNWYRAWSQPEVLTWDMRNVLNQISCPSFIVQGLCDEHATPAHAEDLADSINASELWLVPGIGHMLPQEAPSEFNQRLIAFLLAQCPL